MSRRGFALVAVMGVLALLFIVFAVLAKLLADDLAETRRRGNAAYAAELARSGLAVARASIAAGGGVAPTTLAVAGGRIEVRPEVAETGLRVVAVGSVTSSGAVIARRTASFDAGPAVRFLEAPPSAPVATPSEPPLAAEPPRPDVVTPVPVPER